LIRLAYDRECFRRILEGLTEGVIIIYRDGIVTYANPAACHILSWHGEYEGRLLKSLLCCCDGNLLPFFEVDGSLVPALLDGNVLSGLDKFTSKDSPCVTLEYLVTPLSEDDEVVGAAVILNNISERILAEGELSEANKRLQRLNDELKRKNKRLQESSVTDSLTRLYNHRHIIERLQEHVSASDRYQRHLSVMMFDIDFFKKVNDTYGHPFGDEVLEQVSKTLRQEIRTVDIAGRYGGEEFLVVMPETDLSEALVIAERVRLAMEALTWKHPITLTISAGVAMWQKGENASELISRADTLLYKAKEGGRNLVKG
jgi:diguanylate cyclase (GGDEF)-like protein